MGKVVTDLQSRIVGSPLSTLVGTLAGAINLGFHAAVGTIDWANMRQSMIAAASAGIPVVVGALMKAAPKLDPQASALSQQIADAAAAAAQQAAIDATNRVIADIQKLGNSPTEAGSEGGKV